MHYKRIIARLDIKGADLVKGIHLEGLRVLGNPNFLQQNIITIKQMNYFIKMLLQACMIVIAY